MLKVRELDVFYGIVQALRGVSIDVGEGSLVTIIGANGAGKTTFLKSVSGLIKPRSGSIEFLEARIEKLPPHNIVSLGIVQVTQERNLFPRMSVLENLELGLYRASDGGSKSLQEKLEQVYGFFGILQERSSQMAGMLSGGEQQMLAIARALMASPRLLLLDEPSAGLAPLITEGLFRIIGDLHHEGLTIILVEQNASLALETAGSGYLLENGSIVLSGDVSDLAESDLVKRAYLGI